MEETLKVMVNGEVIKEITPFERKIIEYTICDPFEADMERRAQYFANNKNELRRYPCVFSEKILNNLGRIAKEWEPKLIERGIPIPISYWNLAELVFAQPDYKDRATIEAELTALVKERNIITSSINSLEKTRVEMYAILNQFPDSVELQAKANIVIAGCLLIEETNNISKTGIIEDIKAAALRISEAETAATIALVEAQAILEFLKLAYLEAQEAARKAEIAAQVAQLVAEALAAQGE